MYPNIINGMIQRIKKYNTQVTVVPAILSPNTWFVESDDWGFVIKLANKSQTFNLIKIDDPVQK